MKKAVIYLVTKQTELVVLLIIALSILLIPGYREKLPYLVYSQQAAYFACLLIGFIQLRLMRGTRWERVTKPLCIGVMAFALIGFFCS